MREEAEREPLKRATRATSTLTNSWRKVYNDGFFILGLDEIVSNDDDSDRRAKFDVALGAGIVETLLEDLGWTFALTSQKLFFDPGLEPAWGYKRVFAKPIDIHRLNGIFQDDFYRFPLKDYSEEGDNWFCDLDEIWVEYVKTGFITDGPDSWPQYFKNLVAAEFAVRCAKSLKGDYQNALELQERRTREAESTDAMRGPPQQIKSGDWARSRSGYRRASNNQRP